MFKVSAFQSIKVKYKQHLQQIAELDNLHYYDAQAQFATKWDIEALDFGVMYDESLKSNISQRIWKGVDYAPKESMLTFIKHEKEFVRSMFRDLLNEGKDVAMRISRFQFHCEELFSMLSKKESQLLHHYHDDAICLAYLTLCYPEKYTFYHKDNFYKAMLSMEARQMGSSIPLEKYIKVMKAVHTLSQKDEELIAAYQGKIIPKENFNPKSMTLALDFIDFSAHI